jgi:hypothetical protein
LMKELLEVDPGRRATASQALQMTFVRWDACTILIDHTNICIDICFW